MQKFKASVSKSQKKYNIIVSALSQGEAKEKLHKDGYSVLSIVELSQSDIEGSKFLFQVEKGGEIKSGAILGDDIFKIYVKLRDELGYRVLSLYPEGDIAHEDAQKKSEILEKLEMGYKLRKTKKETPEKKEVEKDQSFYMQKKLTAINNLIEKVVVKIEGLLSSGSSLSDERRDKLERIYEKLVHLKGSTNIIKLQEIGELALSKIGEIELEVLEQNKDVQARELLGETNALLKQFGSSKHFVEANKDYKKIVGNIFGEIKKGFSSQELKNSIKKKKKREQVDTQSYSYLKTVLLLNTYKKKLRESSSEMYKKPLLYFNPLKKTEEKEKFFIKRKVIQQNISLLTAKKSGRVSSYTSAKKGLSKLIESFYSTSSYIGGNLCMGFVIFVLLFLMSVVLVYNNINIFYIPSFTLIYTLPLLVIYSLISHIQKHFLSIIHVGILTTLIIFLQVNF